MRAQFFDSTSMTLVPDRARLLSVADAPTRGA